MTDFGHRPILAAISGQQWVMLPFLIEKGADIAIEDRSMAKERAKEQLTGSSIKVV